MRGPAISVRGLGKQYVIGRAPRQDSLRDLLRSGWRAFVPSSRSATFWALDDVSFDVAHGEVVGVIGRNGAGKSTLLKIITQITEPTRGEVRIRGRVASLLEVGTGFHPELTGRENIFLNAAILGMTKAEIRRKLDMIVEFSEIERFLDTPVKRYSSGMYVRLAFAVAAHLEPEVLLVDEVLAVGDIAFQRKCLGKLEDVAREGRTVLFVSHNLSVVGKLCNRVIVLEGGRVAYAGDVQAGIARYLESMDLQPSVDLTAYVAGRRGPQEFGKIIGLAVFADKGEPASSFRMGDPMVIRVTIDVKKRLNAPRIGVMIRNATGVNIHDLTSAFDGFFPDLSEGVHTLEVRVRELRLYPGTYTLGPWLQKALGIPSDDYIRSALEFMVWDGGALAHPGSQFGEVTKEGTETYCPCDWRHL